jgi:hypothetical protein
MNSLLFVSEWIFTSVAIMIALHPTDGMKISGRLMLIAQIVFNVVLCFEKGIFNL